MAKLRCLSCQAPGNNNDCVSNVWDGKKEETALTLTGRQKVKCKHQLLCHKRRKHRIIKETIRDRSPKSFLVNTNSLKEQSKRLLSIETPISSLTIKNNNLNINCHPPIQSDMEQYLKFFWNRGTVIKNLIMFNFSIWKMQIPAPVLSTMSKHIDFVNWRVSSSYIVLK